MKKLLLISALTLIFCQLHSQDLIVTNKGDSLNCKITTRMSGYIYYKFNQDGKTFNTKLPKTDVRTYKYDYYNQYVDDGTPKDLILTNNMDSIRCKIVSIKQTYIVYSIDTNDATSSSTIPLDNVRYYRHDFYRPKNTGYQKWTISVNGGYSRRWANIAKNLPSNYTQHIEQLRTGYHWGVDFAYYFSENFGIGPKFMIFKSSDSRTIRESIGSSGYTRINSSFSFYFTMYDSYTFIESYSYTFKDVKVNDEHTMPYIGLSASSRLYGIKKRGTLMFNFSVGYLGYTDVGYYDGQSYTIKGHTLGQIIDFGYDYWFTRNMALGARLSLSNGTIKKCTKETSTTIDKIKLKKDEYEGLGRIDFSVGLRLGGNKNKK